jgi:hypothetical protein
MHSCVEQGFESVSCGSFFTLSKFDPDTAGNNRTSPGEVFSPENTENFAARSINAAFVGKVKLPLEEFGR